MTLQLYDYTDDELRNVMKQVQNDGLAIFTEQCYDEAQLASIFKRVGECEAPGLFMNDKNVPEIFKVSGERDAEGNKIGMFGDGELGWHSNGNSRHQIDKILIGLYCVKEDINTTLSVCNTQQPFYDMSKDEQEYYRSITIRLKFKNNTIYDLEEGDPELEFMSKNKGSIRKLVGEHPHTGKEYFYFPYHFICKAWEGKKQIDHEELISKLKPKIFKSQYQYHHIFKEGDLLLMDQFTSLHRRTPVMDNNRLLWRIASDFKNVYK